MGNALCMFCLCSLCRLKGSLPWHLAVAKSSGHCSKSVIQWPQFRIMVRAQLMVLQTVDIVSADGSA
jgi:hypothetical protein